MECKIFSFLFYTNNLFRTRIQNIDCGKGKARGTASLYIENYLRKVSYTKNSAKE